jgi:hypothetical protein
MNTQKEPWRKKTYEKVTLRVFLSISFLVTTFSKSAVG